MLFPRIKLFIINIIPKLIIILLSLLINILLSDTLYFESENNLNSNFNTDSQESYQENKTLYEKFKNFPWAWIGVFTFLILIYYYTEQLPETADIKYYLPVTDGSYTLQTLTIFVEAGKSLAIKKGLIEGSPEFEDFLEKFVVDNYLSKVLKP